MTFFDNLLFYIFVGLFFLMVIGGVIAILAVFFNPKAVDRALAWKIKEEKVKDDDDDESDNELKEECK